MIAPILERLVERHDLSLEEARAAVEAVMAGRWSEAEIAALLVALRSKGETSAEIAGAALALRHYMVRIEVDRAGLLDTCGTGGDAACTFNISTATALVVAACGVPVAKHGNRSVSSPCGSAEVLEALGVRIELPLVTIERSIRELNLGFLYAPPLHPAMRHAAAVRRELRIRTLFNIIGPLSNPAGARLQLLGVGHEGLARRMAEALIQLGTGRAFLVRGRDGLDEVTLGGPTAVLEVSDGSIREFEWTPADFGLPPCRLAELQVRSAAESAERIRGVLAGRSGPARDVVLANAAAALLLVGAVERLPDGVQRAAAAIDSGRASATLGGLVRLSQE